MNVYVSCVDTICLLEWVFSGPKGVDKGCPLFFVLINTRFEKIASRQKKTKAMKDIVHIGSLIQNELRRQDRTNRWLAERINVHPRTINKIFQKNVIDTQQLLHISYAMGVDFFEVYSKLLKDMPKLGM